MQTEHDKGYLTALGELGDTFARLADQAQGEVTAAIGRALRARADCDPAAERRAETALHEALALKIAWMKALEVTMNAESRRRAAA